MSLEIDSRCRVLIFKPMKEAKPVDLLADKKKANMESKEKEGEYYQKHRDFLIQGETNRLKNKAKRTKVVRDFDCGLCAKCRVRDRSICDDGYNCKKKQGRITDAEASV